MNQFPQMIYKAGGTEDIHGGKFSTLIVHDAAELGAALAGGWSLTTTEALEAPDRERIEAEQRAEQERAAAAAAAALTPPSDDNAPPTRDELKQKATELGLTFAGNISTEKLAGLVDAALAEQAKG